MKCIAAFLTSSIAAYSSRHAPALLPGSEPWRTFRNANAYNGHGAVAIDNAPVTVTSLAACETRCTDDTHCSCVVFDTASSQCWKRSECVSSAFTLNNPKYATYVRTYTELSGVRCEAGVGIDTNKTAPSGLSSWDCAQRCEADANCDCAVLLLPQKSGNKSRCWKRGKYTAGHCASDTRYVTLLRPSIPYSPPPTPAPTLVPPSAACEALIPPDPRRFPPTLPRHSVSGFSSGGDQAIIHLIAFSSYVDGATILGGAPYGCQILPDSPNACSGINGAWPVNDTAYLAQLQQYILERNASGVIDRLAHLIDTPILLYSGLNDSTVHQPVMRAVAKQLEWLHADVYSVFDLVAQHAWAVDNTTCVAMDRNLPLAEGYCCGKKSVTINKCALPNATYRPPVPRGGQQRGGTVAAAAAANGGAPDGAPLQGGCCGSNLSAWSPPINNVNFDLSGEMLRHIYNAKQEPNVAMSSSKGKVTTATKLGNRSQPWSGGVKPKTRFVERNLLRFNQTDFVPRGCEITTLGMDPIGMVYVPSGCRPPRGSTAACARAGRVHVHYHPCGGSYHALSTAYALESGTAAYAEANDMIVLHPQTDVKGMYGGGCWDWSGGTGVDFDTHSGLQLRIVIKMLGNLTTLVDSAVWP